MTALDTLLLARARRARRASGKRPRSTAAPTATSSGSPVLSPTQRTGQTVETRAMHWLTTQGLTILARNLRCPLGELDIIAREGDTLVFIEVRYRASLRFGGAAASVTRQKQTRLIRAARWFLPGLVRQFFGGVTPPCRFDVISHDSGDLHWIRHAFTAETN